MQYIIITLALFCGYKIFSNQGQKRFNWFICSMMIFSSYIIILTKPQIPCHRMFILCFWLSVLKNNEYKNKKYPLIIPIVIYIIGIILVSFNSHYLNLFYKIYKPFVLLLDTYLILLLTYFGVRKENFMSRPIILTLLFVTLYGLTTMLISFNPIQEIVASSFGFNILEGYYFGDRIRITSTWSHPIAYGLVCGALFYLYLPYWRKKIILFLMLLLTTNVLVCGSRTALASFFLMGGVIILSRFTLKRTIKYILFSSVIFVSIYFIVPFVQNKVDSVINTALGNDDVAGSSIEMRDMQTFYAMTIVNKKPLLGHGLDYIHEEMKFGTDEFTGDWQLLGLESYIYILLIERGFTGLILELFLWLSIISYAYKQRKKDRINTSLIISYIIGFAFFSISTGTLDTKIPMLFLIGTSLSKIDPKLAQ